jgi:hypothetical protein
MNAMRVVTQVALTGMRVVTQDFGRKSKLKFLVITQVDHMSSRSLLESPLYIVSIGMIIMNSGTTIAFS